MKMRHSHDADPPKFVERQLWHLAVADLFYAIFSIPYCLQSVLGAQLAHDMDPSTIGAYIVCDGVGVLYSAGLNTSILVTAHLALGFAAAVSHQSRLLDVLRRSLPLLWLVGISLAVVAIFVGGATRSQHTWHHYSCYRSNEGIAFISTVLGAISFVWCIACSIFCSVRVRSSGEALVARGWRRAQLYPAVVLVTFGPLLLVATGLLPNAAEVIIACTTVVCLNGFFNTLVYIIQRRSALRTESRYVSIGDLLLPEDLR